MVRLDTVGLTIILVRAVAVHVRRKEALVPSVPLPILLILSVVLGFLPVGAHVVPVGNHEPGAAGRQGNKKCVDFVLRASK